MSETRTQQRPLPNPRRTTRGSARDTFSRTGSVTLATRFRSLARVTEPSYGGVFEKVQRFFRTKSEEQLDHLQKGNISTVNIISNLVDVQNDLIRKIIDELKDDELFNIDDFFGRIRGGAAKGRGVRGRSAARVAKARERLARQQAAKTQRRLASVGRQAAQGVRRIASQAATGATSIVERGRGALAQLRERFIPRTTVTAPTATGQGRITGFLGRTLTAVGVGLSASEEFARSRDIGRATAVGGGVLGGVIAGGALGSFAGPLGSIAGSIVGGMIGEERTRAAIESIVNPSLEALERGRTAIQQGAGGPMIQAQISRGELIEQIRASVRNNTITRDQANELNRSLLSGVSLEQVRQRFEQIKVENQRPQQRSSIEGLATLASFTNDADNDAVAIDDTLYPENIIDILMRTEFQELNLEADKIEFDGKISVPSTDIIPTTMPTAMGGYTTPAYSQTMTAGGQTQSPISRDNQSIQPAETTMRAGGSITSQAQSRQSVSTPQANPTDRPGVTGDFMSEVNRVSSRFGINPSDLLALMRAESGINPQAVNASTGATGLIQFMPATARGLGTTVEALRQMTAVQQMQYVERFFQSVNLPRGASAGRLYAYVFLPGRANRDILTSRGENFYEANRGLDVDGDGNITIRDLDARMSRFGGSGAGLAAAGTDMTASDQAQMRAGQQIIMIPGQPGVPQNQQTVIPNQTHRGEVPLRIRFERQVA